LSEPTPKPHVLAVDDEEHITELVAMALGIHGFEVERASAGRAALAAIEARRPDLVLLDVMLPDLDGVEGLRLGVDDYVTKPFSVEELVERVKAVLRRTGGTAGRTHTITFHDLALDEETRDVWRGGKFIDLTPTEYKLLHYLLANAKKVLTRDQILEAVWDYTFAGNASVLETYISYLRHKIDDVDPPLIHTVRGVGYSMRLPR
jgi:two-component system OmpR family response regulator